jgi:hypothetical protein
MTTITASDRAALDPYYQDRIAALAALPAAKAALERGQRIKADAEVQVAIANQAVESYQAAQGRRLAERITDGAGVELVAVEPEAEGLLLKLASAQQCDAVAAQALAMLQASYVDALSAVTSAEAALARAVDKIGEGKAVSTAAEILRIHDQVLTRLGRELRDFCADGLNQPVNAQRPLAADIQRALSLTRGDDLYIPSNVLMGLASGSWAATRAALIAGNSGDDNAAYAAA